MNQDEAIFASVLVAGALVVAWFALGLWWSWYHSEAMRWKRGEPVSLTIERRFETKEERGKFLGEVTKPELYGRDKFPTKKVKGQRAKVVWCDDPLVEMVEHSTASHIVARDVIERERQARQALSSQARQVVDVDPPPVEFVDVAMADVPEEGLVKASLRGDEDA